MSLFFLIIFGVYGGMHVYAFLRARTALGFGPGTGIVLALFMLLMVFAIFLVRFLEVYEYDRTARSLAYLAYFWMALLFLFFCGSVVIDIFNLLIRCSGWLMRANLASILIVPRISFSVSMGLALVISVYGYFEAL